MRKRSRCCGTSSSGATVRTCKTQNPCRSSERPSPRFHLDGGQGHGRYRRFHREIDVSYICGPDDGTGMPEKPDPKDVPPFGGLESITEEEILKNIRDYPYVMGKLKDC